MANVGFALAQAFVRIRPSTTGFRADATGQIKGALAGVQGDVPLVVDADLAELKISELRAYLQTLTDRAWEFKVGADSKAAELAIQRIFAQLRSLDARTANPKITLEGIARAQTQLLGVDVALDRIIAKFAEAEVVAKTTDFSFKGWGTKIPLFGGLAGIGVIHLLASAVTEFLAVLIPATVAFGVFGIAGIQSVKGIIQQFQTANTVGQAMNRNLLPLGGTFQKMENAVHPQVYALLGDVLQVAGSKAGIFTRLARQAGTVLDQLASRATLAIKSAGFSQFLAHAAPDLQKLGTVAGNIFGIIGGLLKGVAGIAGHVLDFFVALTHVLENIANSPITQWIFRMLDGLHGLLVYAGLATTGLVLLGRPLGALAGLFGAQRVAAEEGAGALGKAAAGWQTLGGAIGLAGPKLKTGETVVGDVAKTAEEGAGKTGLLSKAFGLLGGSFGWVGLAATAAVGLGILIYALVNAKSATTQWADSLQRGIDVQTTLIGVQHATEGALGKVNNAYATATGQLKAYNGVREIATSHGIVIDGQYAQEQSRVQDLAAAHQQYAGELQTENNRLAQLTRVFGSVSQAQGLMNQAGIKATDIAKASQSQWRQDVQTLVSLESAIKATADASGAAGQNEKILNYELTSQYTNVQKLNQGWDTFVGLVTSTQTAFDTVAQGITTLNTQGGTLNLTLGKLSASATYVKSNIDSLTPSGIALNQAFSQQVVNFNALFDTWRTSGLSLNAITGGVKAAIATLLPFAAGSQEATAQLAALAAQAGYNLPANFKVLQQWVGNVSGAEGILKRASDEATLSQLALSGAFQSTGNAIAQHLINNINGAILAYHGVYAAATAYGKALAASGGQMTGPVHKALQNLVNDIYASGKAAHQSQGEIVALIQKMLGIPKSVATKLYMSAQGNYTVSAWAAKVQNAAINQRPAATGWRVPGYGGGDRFPALLEGGEAVVPKHLTPYLAPFLKKHGVPGFAAGGLVGAGVGSQLGNYAQQAYNTFSITALNALISQLRSALYASELAESRALQAAGYGFRIYDQGGYLPMGMSLAYNGTGSPELVGGAQEVKVVLEWAGTDTGLFSAFREGIRSRGGLKRVLGP